MESTAKKEKYPTWYTSGQRSSQQLSRSISQRMHNSTQISNPTFLRFSFIFKQLSKGIFFIHKITKIICCRICICTLRILYLKAVYKCFQIAGNFNKKLKKEEQFFICSWLSYSLAVSLKSFWKCSLIEWMQTCQ